MCCRLAGDPRVAALAPDLRWDFPLRLLAGLHYGMQLVLDGRLLEEHLDYHG